jgi:propanol-preferring alcohol dehydrogenase
MCGGVTAYTACKRSAVKPGQWLVVTGAGGGLGHLGLQYAKAMGMRVIAIDGGDEKAKLCKDLGAEEYLDFTSVKDMAAEITRITKYGAHAVIVFAASKESYAAAPNFLRPGGTVVAVGLPADPSVVAGAPPIQLALKRLNIVGSVTGTLKDVEEAYVVLNTPMIMEVVNHTDWMIRLDFTARGLVHPILTKGTLDDVDKFCEMLKHGKLPGRAVLKVSS